MSRIRDLKGQRFGKLLVVSKGDNDKNHRATWNCKCDCGKITNVKSANLISGRTNSCGCIRVNNLVGKNTGNWQLFQKKKIKGLKQEEAMLCTFVNVIVEKTLL